LQRGRVVTILSWFLMLNLILLITHTSGEVHCGQKYCQNRCWCCPVLDLIIGTRLRIPTHPQSMGLTWKIPDPLYRTQSHFDNGHENDVPIFDWYQLMERECVTFFLYLISAIKQIATSSSHPLFSMSLGRVAFEKLTELDYRGTTYYTVKNLSLYECQGWCREEPDCQAASFR